MSIEIILINTRKPLEHFYKGIMRTMRTSFFNVSILSLVLALGIVCAGCLQHPGNNQEQLTTPTPVQTTLQPSPVATESPVATPTPVGQTPPPVSVPNGTLIVSGAQGQISALKIRQLTPQMAALVLSGGSLTANRANVLLSNYNIGSPSTYQVSTVLVLPMQPGTYLLEVDLTTSGSPSYYLTTILPHSTSNVYVGENAVAARVAFNAPVYTGG
jgi:hypothetical protein